MLASYYYPHVLYFGKKSLFSGPFEIRDRNERMVLNGEFIDDISRITICVGPIMANYPEIVSYCDGTIEIRQKKAGQDKERRQRHPREVGNPPYVAHLGSFLSPLSGFAIKNFPALVALEFRKGSKIFFVFYFEETDGDYFFYFNFAGSFTASAEKDKDVIIRANY